MRTKCAVLFGAILLAQLLFATDGVKRDQDLETGRQAWEASDYPKAAQLLQQAAARNPKDAEIQWWLAKTYYETQQRDAAVSSAERAVALEPRNSVYHEWLGRAYGDKADHVGPISAMVLAKKAGKEFTKAVELDERNFAARQALIEFYCAAPGIVGGGEDKARPEIARLAALDAAEGHYAAGNCRRQKKDFPAAETEFDEALAAHPSSADLIYDIGDYALKRNQPERLITVADEGERAEPTDPRGMFYRAVALVLKQERPADVEGLLRSYIEHGPVRNNFPHPGRAHEWLGRFYENQHDAKLAAEEYEAALTLEPKNKYAREALKRLRKG